MGPAKLIATLLVLLAVAAGSSGAWANDTPASEPREPDACAKLALSYLDAAEDAQEKAEKIAAYSKGRDLALQALALDKANADALFVVFAAEGRLELINGAIPNPINLYKAQGRLDQVLALNPSHPRGLAAKGGLYRQLPWALGGDLDKAEDYLKRSIEHNPKAIGARIELAATYLEKGEPEKCAPLLDKAVSLAREEGKAQPLEEAKKLRAEISSR